MPRIDMPTFAGGELGEDLLSRSDTAKFRTALRRARNVLLSPAGGFYNRSGLLFAGPVHDHERKTRLVPFQFSVSQGYALELGHHTLRVVLDGGYVLRKELLVTGIENGATPWVYAVAHGYLVGWDVVFEQIEGMVEINGRQARVTEVEPDRFRISLDTSAYGVFTGAPTGVAGDAAGGSGGEPPPPAPTPPEEPPPPPPPFQDYEPPPFIYGGDGGYYYF